MEVVLMLLYGKSDLQSDGSYLTTQWVGILGIPIIPLRGLRAKPVGVRYELRSFNLINYRQEGVPNTTLEKLKCLENQEFTEEEFLNAIKEQIGEEETIKYKETFLKYPPFIKETYSKEALSWKQVFSFYSYVLIAIMLFAGLIYLAQLTDNVFFLVLYTVVATFCFLMAILIKRLRFQKKWTQKIELQKLSNNETEDESL